MPAGSGGVPRWAAPAAIVALAAALLLVRLGQPDWTPERPRPDLPLRYVWDEGLYAFTVHRRLLGDPHVWDPDATTETIAAFAPDDMAPHAGYAVHHPPLASFAMELSSSALGWSEFAVRLPGALCGLALVALTWALGVRVRGRAAAALAAALVALDGVVFTISRLAIPHVYVAACVVGAAVAALVAWEDDARRPRWTVLTGVLCGLGLAFKTSALPPTVVLAAALLVRGVRRAPAGGRLRALATWAVAFVVVPPAVYLASWLPYLLSPQGSWEGLAALHAHMRNWHAAMPASMGPSTPWWTWPVHWRPVRLYHEVTAARETVDVYVRGNPLLWWAALPAVAWQVVTFARRPRAAPAWVAGGYLVTWLVYAAVPRYGFSYYLLPAAPFAAVAVGAMLEDAAGREPRRRATVLVTWGAAAAAAFALAYPLLAAVPRPL